MALIKQLDTRGRLVIPRKFQEILNLRGEDVVLLSMDQKTSTLIISPIYVKQSDLLKIEIGFVDSLGCFAKIADELVKMNINLIVTKSKRFQRGKKTRWNIIADLSNSNYSANEIEKKFLQTDLVDSISVKKYSSR